MSVALAAALMVIVGAQLAPQAAINREVSLRTSGLIAALMSFVVGLAALVAVCAITGQLDAIGGVFGLPPTRAAGGLLGASFVVISILAVGAIGASGVAACAVAGQMTASVLLDAVGALHLERESLTATLVLGAAAILAGTYLVVGGRSIGRSSGRAGLLASVAVVCGGAMLGLQHPLNHDLAASIGDLPSATVNSIVATLALALLVSIAGQARRIPSVKRVPPLYFVGGLMGAINATASLILVGFIGAGGVAAAGVTGQMIASLALDRAAVLGLRRRPVNRSRVLGAMLLIVGTVLVALP